MEGDDAHDRSSFPGALLLDADDVPCAMGAEVLSVAHSRTRSHPSTYEQRRIDIGRLFYDMTRDEMDLRRPNDGDVAARLVMADALEERGMGRLARELRRWPRTRKLGGTLFHQKLRRAVMGPEERQTFSPRKPAKRVLLALLGGEYLKVDRSLIEDSGGRDYVLGVPLGNFGIHFHVRARSEEDALEAAAERWPFYFLDELEEDDERMEDAMPHPKKRGVWAVWTDGISLTRPAQVHVGRVVNDRDEAFVPGVGIVGYRS